jgi:hypothetical protein
MVYIPPFYIDRSPNIIKSPISPDMVIINIPLGDDLHEPCLAKLVNEIGGTSLGAAHYG